MGREFADKIRHNREVDYQYGQRGPGEVVRHREELRREVDPPAQGSEPFGPPPSVPQAERLDEADDGVKERRKGQEPDFGVGDVGGRVEKDAGVVPRGIQMDVPDELFRRVVEAAMDEGEDPESRDEDQRSLGALEHGDHPEAAIPGFSGHPIHRAMPNATAAANPPIPTVE